MTETGREGWTSEERELYDTQADHEGWSFAQEFLEPWMEVTRLIGSDELTRIMEKALAEAEREVSRTVDVLEPLVEREK